jgi:hypothetical protein
MVYIIARPGPRGSLFFFEGAIVIYHCTSCDDPQNFETIAVEKTTESGMPTEYTLARCGSCGRIALFCREDIFGGFENENYYRLWPPHSRHLGFDLPKIVQQSYNEAVKCETAKAYLAAVVMVRRALEAVTKEHEPTARSLHTGLQAMFSRGLVSKEISDWGNELRVIGNLGAHATEEKVDRQDAVEAIDFLQAILEILYDLRPKFERMRARRSTPVAALSAAAPAPASDSDFTS